MIKKRPRKKIFLERETKYRTFQIESETQKNHPRIVNVTNKMIHLEKIKKRRIIQQYLMQKMIKKKKKKFILQKFLSQKMKKRKEIIIIHAYLN